MRKVVLSLIALMAISIVAMPALADIAYSNLGSPPSYNCCSGWTVGGINSPVGLVNDAEQFTSSVSGNVNQIDVGLGWVTGGNPSATIQLWTSVGDLPGTMLGSGTVSNLPVFGSTSTILATITGNLGAVTAGNQYFVVILADAGAWEAWNWNDTNATGLLLQDSGNGWNSFPGQVDGAFDVLTGSGVPEPGTFVMLGSGVVALAGAFRRKINL
jgi:hypothetical protein